VRKLILSAIFLTTFAAFGQNASRFDGTWNTTVTCEPKGGALGYTLHFVSTVSGGVLHGERGTKGQPAYLAIDGKIGNGGNAKLTASGNTASAAYPWPHQDRRRGVQRHWTFEKQRPRRQSPRHTPERG